VLRHRAAARRNPTSPQSPARQRSGAARFLLRRRSQDAGHGTSCGKEKSPGVSRSPRRRAKSSDAVLLSSGNVLFAHQFGVTLIDRIKKVLWHYDAPAGTEIHHRATHRQEPRALYAERRPRQGCGCVNIVTGKTEREFVVPVKNPKSVHGHFRHARLTEGGTLLVAHMDMGKWSNTTPPQGTLVMHAGYRHLVAERLKNGDTLIAGAKLVREVNPPGPRLGVFAPRTCRITCSTRCKSPQRLPNGNTLIDTWFNQWDGPADPRTAPVQRWKSRRTRRSSGHCARGKAGGSRSREPRFSCWISQAFPRRYIRDLK